MACVNIFHTIVSLFLTVSIILTWFSLSSANGIKFLPRHYHQRFSTVSYDTGNCGIIPKIKVRERSRDPGITSFGQIPWQVGIFYKPENLLICSGTLITSDLVFTSATCLLTLESFNDIEIRLGDWDISNQDSPQETYDHFSTSLSDVMFYPDNPVGERMTPIAALLRLEDPVDFHSYPQISPICLPPLGFIWKSENITDFCLVSGWGSQNRMENKSIHEPNQNESFESLEQRDGMMDQNLNSKSKETKDAAKDVTPQITQENSGLSSQITQSQNEGKQIDWSIENSLESVINKRQSEQPYKLQKDVLITKKSDIKVPDPVDYVEPNSEEETGLLIHSQNGDLSSKSRENLDKSKEDSLPSPISLQHEANVHNHKRKYKQGKLIGTKILSLENDSRHKRSYDSSFTFHGGSKKLFLGKQRQRRLYQSHAEPEKATLLKIFRVRIGEQSSLSPDQDNSVKDEYCITPMNGHYLKFSCMTDLGSPVFCIPPNSSKQIRRRKRFRSQDQDTQRAYLVGFVSNWNLMCHQTDFEKESISHTDYFNSVPITPFNQNIIQFIYDKI